MAKISTFNYYINKIETKFDEVATGIQQSITAVDRKTDEVLTKIDDMPLQTTKEKIEEILTTLKEIKSVTYLLSRILS